MTIDVPIAKRLRRIRRKANVSAYKVSLAIGGSRGAGLIWKIEKNRCTPLYSTVVKLAKYFEVPPSYFYLENDYEARRILKKFDEGKN